MLTRGAGGTSRRSPSVQRLSRAVLVGQADGNAQCGDTPVADELLGRVHQQCRDALPPGRPGHGDLVNKRDAAAAESRVTGLPDNRDVTDDIGTGLGDQACAVRFRVIGEVSPRLGLAVTDLLDEEPDDRPAQVLAGWATERTPQRYTRHRPARLWRPAPGTRCQRRCGKEHGGA